MQQAHRPIQGANGVLLGLVMKGAGAPPAWGFGHASPEVKKDFELRKNLTHSHRRENAIFPQYEK
jgi:hypothetical protein